MLFYTRNITADYSTTVNNLTICSYLSLLNGFCFLEYTKPPIITVISRRMPMTVVTPMTTFCPIRQNHRDVIWLHHNHHLNTSMKRSRQPEQFNCAIKTIDIQLEISQSLMSQQGGPQPGSQWHWFSWLHTYD